MRLALALLIGSIGSVGMWSVVVVLPVVQPEFGASRGAVSLAFTLTMLGFGLGGIVTGRITDRFGIVTAISLSIAILGSGYLMAGLSTTLWQFIAVHFLIGLGTSATFGPLMAEASHWFERYRGLAVTIVASGNYLAGTIWPTWPIGERQASRLAYAPHIAVGIFCAVAMSIVLLLLRAQIGVRRVRNHENAPPPLRRSSSQHQCIDRVARHRRRRLLRGDSRVPRVHIVAYCGDLGYGVARSTEMLSMMLAFGIVSRIGSGFLADKIGGLRTLLIGSIAQGVALLFYLFFDSLSSLYIIAMFGLFQGGIVPSYAIIVREIDA